MLYSLEGSPDGKACSVYFCFFQCPGRAENLGSFGFPLYSNKSRALDHLATAPSCFICLFACYGPVLSLNMAGTVAWPLTERIVIDTDSIFLQASMN